MPRSSKPKPPPDPNQLVRQSAGTYRSGDDRFEVRQSGIGWFLVDSTQTDELGQELVQGPFPTLAAVRDAIPDARRTTVRALPRPKKAFSKTPAKAALRAEATRKPKAEPEPEPVHRLLEVLLEAANDRFPPADLAVEVVPPPPDSRTDAVVAFSGHTLVVADVDAARIRRRLAPDDPGAPMSPDFLAWLGKQLGAEPGMIDAVLVAQPGWVSPKALRLDPVARHEGRRARPRATLAPVPGRGLRPHRCRRARDRDPRARPRRAARGEHRGSCRAPRSWPRGRSGSSGADAGRPTASRSSRRSRRATSPRCVRSWRRAIGPSAPRCSSSARADVSHHAVLAPVGPWPVTRSSSCAGKRPASRLRPLVRDLPRAGKAPMITRTHLVAGLAVFVFAVAFITSGPVEGDDAAPSADATASASGPSADESGAPTDALTGSADPSPSDASLNPAAQPGAPGGGGRSPGPGGGGPGSVPPPAGSSTAPHSTPRPSVGSGQSPASTPHATPSPPPPTAAPTPTPPPPTPEPTPEPTPDPTPMPDPTP